MPRPVGKTIQADWWDADESVTYRAALNLLELQQVEQGLVTFGELMGSTAQQDMPRVVALIADMVMAVLLPAKFLVHVVDSDPNDPQWVAFEQAAIATMPADDLLYIIQEIPYRRRTPAQAYAPVVLTTTPTDSTVEERGAGAVFPADDAQHAVLNGAGAPAVQASV